MSYSYDVHVTNMLISMALIDIAVNTVFERQEIRLNIKWKPVFFFNV
jgi:hypothetical protein